MAKVPQYTQDKLASSLQPVVIDNSAAQLTETIRKDVDSVAINTLELSAKKQREVDKLNARIKDVNDTLTAYDMSIALENEMYDIIEEEKANNINNPQLAVKNIETRGRELITTSMANLNDTTDLAVKEKLSGIVTNSLRGKLSELHSWQVAQDTANAQNKIMSIVDGLATRASKTGDLKVLAECLNFDNYPDSNGQPFGDSIKLAYGAKGLNEIRKAKGKIAESYILGFLDRNAPGQINAILDTGALDEYIPPEDKIKYKKMAKTMSNAQSNQAKLNNYFEILNIMEGARISSAKGEYTPSQYERDKKRIQQLGGKTTNFNGISSSFVQSEKALSKQEFEARRRAANDEVNVALSKVTGKTKNIKASETLEDIIKFQNLLDKNRPYLTDQVYNNYSQKCLRARQKRVEDMKKDIFGRPAGTLRGDDNYSKGINQIFDFADKNYKNDRDGRNDAINRMVDDFVKEAEQMEAQNSGKLSESQMQAAVKKVTNNQAQRTNPYLQNLPKNGALFKDRKTGVAYRMYPDGRRERIK